MTSRSTLSSRISSTNTAQLICTITECTDDQDADSLQCSKCKRMVHYRCTKLPAYQIHLFKTRLKNKSYRYQCQNCVEVPQDLLDLIPNRERSHSSRKTEKEIENLKRDIKGCENLIKHQEENEKELQNTIKSKQSDLNNLKEKLQTNPGYHSFEYIENKMEKQIADLETKIKEYVTSYASALKSSSQPTDQQQVVNLKDAIESARTEELVERRTRR